VTHRVVSAVTALFLLLPAASFAAGLPYVSVLAGYTAATDSDAGDFEDMQFDNAFTSVSGSAALGEEYLLGYGRVRFEAEVSYRRNKIDRVDFQGNEVDADGHVMAVGFMANGYYSMETGTAVLPYVMAGGGGSWTSIQDVKIMGVKAIDDDQGQWAYQLGGGVSFDLSQSLFLDLAYRYFSTSKDSFQDKAKDSFLFRYRTHSFWGGFRYRF
jgi:outer membrane immunogenic protein